MDEGTKAVTVAALTAALWVLAPRLTAGELGAELGKAGKLPEHAGDTSAGLGSGLPLDAKDAGGISWPHAVPQRQADPPLAVGQAGVGHPPGVTAQFRLSEDALLSLLGDTHFPALV